jgi:gluconolactonase
MRHAKAPAFVPSPRVPDPRVEVLHESFLSLRLPAASVERLATGTVWGEGPVWFGDGRFLLWSDVPGNRIHRLDDTNGVVSVFREPSSHANGLARDRQGRLLTCEHLTRRVTRTEHDGRLTVLADRFEGKRLNSPNDIVCARDGAVWFTDPLFGITSDFEGQVAESETPWAVYRLDPGTQALQRVIHDVAAPNGLAFSPDEKHLYVVESRAVPHRKLWRYAVSPTGSLSDKQLFADAQGPGAYDGIAVDVQGNVWCGFGVGGQATEADAEALDGVRVYNPQGLAIGHIHLPERCANLCFGGPKRNRLYMAATKSLYALYVNVQGAT